MIPRILALMGPTAVGKTDVSIELARRLGAEIVGCDSMQVYRRMAILTQQPTAEQRQAVPHHLIDYVDPSEEFSAGRYRRDAGRVIEEIQGRGKVVLIVGGTGLYLKALAEGLGQVPAVEPRIREALWARSREAGSDALYEELARVDPAAAANIHPSNTRRVVRALEVYEATGRPMSSYWTPSDAPIELTALALTRERTDLYQRIDRRVEQMLTRDGVLDEVRALADADLSTTARQVHGLRFLEAHVRGELGLRELIPRWQQQVRNYAKRQLTWFRAVPGIRWVTAEPRDDVASIVARLADAAACTMEK